MELCSERMAASTRGQSRSGCIRRLDRRIAGCRNPADFRAGSVANAWWRLAAMAEERVINGVKDVVKMV